MVGAIEWELEVLGSQSLKDKRRVVRSLRDRLQTRFRAAAAETGHQDLWQRAAIAACTVSGEKHRVDEVVDAMDRLVRNEMRVRVISARRSYC